MTIAQRWTLLSPAYQSHSVNFSTPTPLGTDNDQYTATAIRFDFDFVIEHVELTVDITVAYRGQLRISLISPSGTESVLSEVHGDTRSNWDSWRFSTLRTWEEDSRGNWILIIEDNDDSRAVLNWWNLEIYGVPL